MNERYSRQLLFAPIGAVGQAKLRNARIFILGAGALGSAGAEMLVRAGVGQVTIVDRDVLEWSNLHRQQLYTEQDVKDELPKAIAAERRLQAINEDVNIRGIVTDVTAQNVQQLITHHDVVMDATDNLETRLLVNDATRLLSIPFFVGACVGSYGFTFPIGVQKEAPCLHCLLPTLPAQTLTCDTAGVISPIVMTIAARQVTDIFKYLTGTPIQPVLQSTDLWTGEHAEITVTKLKQANCPSCSSERTYPFLHGKAETKTTVLCGRETVQLTFPTSEAFDLQQFIRQIQQVVSSLHYNQFLASFHYQGYRIVRFQDGRMLIHGMKDPVLAKRLATALLG